MTAAASSLSDLKTKIDRFYCLEIKDEIEARTLAVALDSISVYGVQINEIIQLIATEHMRKKFQPVLVELYHTFKAMENRSNYWGLIGDLAHNIRVKWQEWDSFRASKLKA